ncbi:hypothetical protein V492_05852 [Pseudogymnoascus sp. VKM F-4246]|nr:hypothetical protein V492_05852 [Pseudogymnoascus sp. VKM F-4246]
MPATGARDKEWPSGRAVSVWGDVSGWRERRDGQWVLGSLSEADSISVGSSAVIARRGRFGEQERWEDEGAWSSTLEHAWGSHANSTLRVAAVDMDGDVSTCWGKLVLGGTWSESKSWSGLLLCPLAVDVGAIIVRIYSHLPYTSRCVEDGSCLDLAGRETPAGTIDAAPERPGIFKIKIEQTPPTDDTPHEVRVERYAAQLARKNAAKRGNGFLITKSDKPSTPHSNAIDQDGTDFSYTTSVYVGSKNKPLRMLVDSGAASTWIMGSTCTKPACKIHDSFGPADSDTYKASTTTFSLEYGTGKVSGTYVEDTLGLAGFSLPVKFGVADDVSDDFNNYPMDGILGLSRVPDAEVPGFAAALIDKKLLDKNIFSVNIYRASDLANNGEITFGGVDDSKFTGEISYTNIAATGGSWVIPVDKAGFNGKDSGLKGKNAIIDTGTTYCFMPPADAESFYANVPGAKVSDDGGSYAVPCTTSIPAEFTFSGVKYSIPSKDWVGGKVGGAATETMCTSNIYSRDATQDGSWLLGDTFLKSVYAVFDLDKSRIGLAAKPAVVTPETSPSSIAATPKTASSTGPTGPKETSQSDISTPIASGSAAQSPTGTGTASGSSPDATMTTGSQGFNAIAADSSSGSKPASPGNTAAAANPDAQAATKDSSASSLLNTHFTLYIAAVIAAAATVL